MAEKIFVIGSNSFTGASFVDFVLDHGIEVIGTSRSAEAHGAFLPYRWKSQRPASAKFKFFQLDLNQHTDELAAAIGDFNPDYVVNFPAQNMVAESWVHPDEWDRTNVVANGRLREK